MKNIISIQHTESIHHTNGMIGSWTDWELSKKGIQEAHNIGMQLQKELNGTEYVMYTSDLKRAYMTASIVGEHIKVEPIIKPVLRELNMGTAVGKTSTWYKEHAKPFDYSIDYKCFDDAESTREHYNRIKPFIHEVLNNEEENIILVSHGGTCGMINSIILGIDIEAVNTLRFHTKAGSVSIFQINNDVTKVQRIGDLSYKK